MKFLAAIVIAFFRSFFCKSDGERAGAAEAKNEVLTAQKKAYFAMKQVPRTSKDGLDKVLREGKL